MYPRWVTYSDGKFKWNNYKITVEDFDDDNLMLQNVFTGHIISGCIYPLIYDQKGDIAGVTYRSLEFYQEVIDNPQLYQELEEQYKIYFGIGLRDLYIAMQRNLLESSEKKLFKKAINVVNDDILTININGLDVSPYPSASKKLMRFMSEDIISDIKLKQYFTLTQSKYFMVFVDPQDLSYHNFENIIPLDNYFRQKLPLLSNEQQYDIVGPMIREKRFDFTMNNVKKHNEGIYTFKLEGTRDKLLDWNQLGIYTVPFNKKSRGGQRFIFMSKLLSAGLTEMIQNCEPDELKENFRMINFVFRYNKFCAGDRKFSSHYDTPYYDGKKSYVSKYTLIIYLTSGSNKPVLKINNTEFNDIAAYTGIIFDQKYEHEGQAYCDNDKIFLRTELIYFDPELEHEPEVAKLFNSACYLTKQSIFNKELDGYADRLFNQISQIRYTLSPSLVPLPLIEKKYEGNSFLTNGHDYWFGSNFIDKKPSCNPNDEKLIWCAMLVILDYFNGTLNGAFFNKITQSQIITDITDLNDIYLYLNNQNQIEPNIEPHNWYIYNNHNKYSVKICNDKIEIDLRDIEILPKEIKFKTTGTFARIHFAGGAGDCLDSDEEIGEIEVIEKCFALPPIKYSSSPSGCHLIIDMFNNDFIVPTESGYMVETIVKIKRNSIPSSTHSEEQ